MILVEDDEYQVDTDGNHTALLYLAHAMSLPKGAEYSKEVLRKLEKSTQVFIKHYPPSEQDKYDQRFQKDFEGDSARCKLAGYPIGVYHLGLRRYVWGFLYFIS
jgi:hypothetical protein